MFGIFKKNQATPEAGLFRFSVVFSTAVDGLSEELAIGMRDIVRASRPLDFVFLPPGSFSIYFSGSPQDEQRAANLAEALRRYAMDNAMTSFGVGVNAGDCVARFDSKGALSFGPVGQTINVAMLAAQQEAVANDRQNP
jgi:class 3 adenylate cyclase